MGVLDTGGRGGGRRAKRPLTAKEAKVHSFKEPKYGHHHPSDPDHSEVEREPYRHLESIGHALE